MSELDLDRARSTLGLNRTGGTTTTTADLWRGSNRDLRGNPTGGPSFELGARGAVGSSSSYGSYSKSALDLGYSSQEIGRAHV